MPHAVPANAVSFGESMGRIGPNAVTRLAEAISAIEGSYAVERVFRAAGLEQYLTRSPDNMVDECEVATLHQALLHEVGAARARTAGWIAGHRTAEYLLRCRIPGLARRLLCCLPAAAASRVLSAAIVRNSWTFVGSGAFSVRHGRPTVFSITDSHVCEQDAAGSISEFYAATFETLFARLVHHQAQVRKLDRPARKGTCLFAVTW